MLLVHDCSAVDITFNVAFIVAVETSPPIDVTFIPALGKIVGTEDTFSRYILQ
jgi:hypothetical protein